MLKVNLSMLRGSEKAKRSLINKQVVMNVKLDNKAKTRVFALFVGIVCWPTQGSLLEDARKLGIRIKAIGIKFASIWRVRRMVLNSKICFGEDLMLAQLAHPKEKMLQENDLLM